MTICTGEEWVTGDDLYPLAQLAVIYFYKL